MHHTALPLVWFLHWEWHMFKHVNRNQVAPLLLTMANLNTWLKDCYSYGLSNSTSLTKTCLPSEKHSPFQVEIGTFTARLTKRSRKQVKAQALINKFQRERSRKSSKLLIRSFTSSPWRAKGVGKRAKQQRELVSTWKHKIAREKGGFPF